MTGGPTRFLRLPDGRAVRCVGAAFPVPIADHVCVAITTLERRKEVEMLLPERWPEMAERALGALIVARLAAQPARSRPGSRTVGR